MPSNKSAAEKVREKRELARKNLPPVRYNMSLLRKAVNANSKTNANGANEPAQPFFDSETYEGSEGNGSRGGSTGYVQSG
ncbi:uncharacterized protein FTOL_05285 [Fusarium torulosum]|uniref:Uncharacterized protein n=1 Tax=Fusarium torulosum TaxID=33205 RepID=A0AAE8SHP7_9HYPO|nr:uncharacterized protein FTOL_05285 [Fusarium torulosum]